MGVKYPILKSTKRDTKTKIMASTRVGDPFGSHARIERSISVQLNKLAKKKFFSENSPSPFLRGGFELMWSAIQQLTGIDVA